MCPQAKYHAGQVLAGEEASRLINISDDNYLVRNAISEVMSYDPLHPHYYKVLPAVEYVIGSVWDRGVNLYAFVDPDKNRVAYIGYTTRLGIESDNYSYETIPEGRIASPDILSSDAGIPVLELHDCRYRVRSFLQYVARTGRRIARHRAERQPGERSSPGSLVRAECEHYGLVSEFFGARIFLRDMLSRR
jgi:hypothetical protein